MAETLDIVKLIEKNPITRLSQDYQSKLLNKIKDKFTDSQQQLFVSSFYCYLNHNSKNEFVIDLDDVWKWMGFSRKDPAKRLLEKDFIKDIDYKILLHLKVEQVEQHGGHNKEQILININTFKKLCLKAGTKKADEIHDYYIGLEELLQEILNEETNELRNQLVIKDKIIEKTNIDNKMQNKIDKHNLLMEKFNVKRCIYVAEIEENRFIKIGSTQDIKIRVKEYKRSYTGINVLFLDVWECDYFRDIESNILQDIVIRQNLQREPVHGHKSNEIVKLTKDFTYENLINIIKNHLNSNINLFTPEQIIEKAKLELENKKLEYNLFNNIINNDKYSTIIEDIIKNKFSETMDKINFNKMINKDNINNIPNEDNNIEIIRNKKNNTIDLLSKETALPNYKEIINTKNRTIRITGRKVVRINPNNFMDKKLYECMAYATNENSNCNDKGIRNAIKSCKIYKNYRWMYIERNQNIEDCIISPTIKSNSLVNGTIIELNANKTIITNTFSSVSKIVVHFKISKNKVKNIIDNNIKYSDKYFIHIDKCPKELLNNYNGLIKRRISKNTKLIKRIDPNTNEFIIFNSCTEITKLFGFSCKSIISAINKKHNFGGFLWEYYYIN